MPVLFKLFLFLLLQQGGRFDTAPGFNLEAILLSRPMTLTIEGEEDTTSEVVRICNSFNNNYDIEHLTLKDGRLRIVLSFHNMAYAQRSKIMERVKPLVNRVGFQWVDL